jgi:general secretion pathway protein G
MLIVGCPYGESGKLAHVVLASHDLDALVKGEDVQGKEIRFLRRIPVDPMTKTTEWGLRSIQDDPDSGAWGGQNVFDVYTKSQGEGLDGTKYKDW